MDIFHSAAPQFVLTGRRISGVVHDTQPAYLTKNEYPTSRQQHRNFGVIASKPALSKKNAASKEITHKRTVDLVTQYDVATEQFIIEKLRAAFPEHTLIGEETHRGDFGTVFEKVITSTRLTAPPTLFTAYRM